MARFAQRWKAERTLVICLPRNLRCRGEGLSCKRREREVQNAAGAPGPRHKPCNCGFRATFNCRPQFMRPQRAIGSGLARPSVRLAEALGGGVVRGLVQQLKARQRRHPEDWRPKQQQNATSQSKNRDLRRCRLFACTQKSAASSDRRPREARTIIAGAFCCRRSRHSRRGCLLVSCRDWPPSSIHHVYTAGSRALHLDPDCRPPQKDPPREAQRRRLRENPAPKGNHPTPRAAPRTFSKRTC
mmetsp:Transcript_147794/g.473031  ORF Transcript_147794/g.473031 Transcript_147794/m.473031 type:complete len:243 (-) Transcript_147794:1175-1903(-)